MLPFEKDRTRETFDQSLFNFPLVIIGSVVLAALLFAMSVIAEGRAPAITAAPL